MLISLSKNFLFVHVPKTAGSSLHHVLEPHALPRNRTPWRRILSHLPVREDVSKAYFRQHSKALDFQKKIDPSVFAGLHKFAAVRNPYDHMVSYYRFIQKNRKGKRYHEAQSWSFADAVSYFEQKDKLTPVNQTSWLIGRNGEFIVDRVLFFETIAQDVKDLAEYFGLGDVREIPHHNASARGNYRDYYDDSLKRRVEMLYEADFENFGYTFDRSAPTKNPLIAG